MRDVVRQNFEERPCRGGFCSQAESVLGLSWSGEQHTVHGQDR